MSSILSGIYSDILPRKLSGISSGILRSILLTPCLAFSLMFSGIIVPGIFVASFSALYLAFLASLLAL